MNKMKRYRPNLSEIAYDEIKAMILSGELAQGERMLLDELSDQLNLSVTPIREALNRLGQENLVTITPRTSHTVVSFSIEDVNEILGLRHMLETFALRTSGNNLSQFPVQMFRELFQQSYSTENYTSFLEADARFHKAIIVASENKQLEKLYSYINNLLRVLLIPAAHKSRIEIALQEHLAILDAIEAQNVDLAVEQLTFHLERVKVVLMQIYKKEEAGSKDAARTR